MLQGWVYVMVNTSMHNMVKVGRTTREPQLRVAELSSATGVPTPFVLEFGQIYEDCARAEREIHNVLDEKGLRVSANREFFRGPAKDIVRIILAHARKERPSTAPGPGAGAGSDPDPVREELAVRAASGDCFAYAEIAAGHTAFGEAPEALRAWELFFAAHEASAPGPGALPAGVLKRDPRTIRACRRYVACCLMLGQVPGHRPFLLQAADAMLDQQMADLNRWRGTPAGQLIAAAMRWIFENLAPGLLSDGGYTGLDPGMNPGMHSGMDPGTDSGTDPYPRADAAADRSRAHNHPAAA